MAEKKIRAQLDESNYDNVKKLVNFPPSSSYNDSITELIRQFKNLKKGDS